MKVGELIAKQLDKLGVDTTSEELKAIVGISVEMPETISSKFDTGLISLDSAKNNTDIKNHYIKTYASGLSRNLNEKLKSLGLSNEEIDGIFKEEGLGFGKRIELALERLSEAKEAQIKAKKLGDPDAEKVYKEQIEGLNKTLAELKEQSKAELQAEREKNENEKISDEIGREFLSKGWSKSYPEATQDRLVIANTYLQNELQQMNAKLVRDPETRELKLVQAKNPELDYFDSSNKKVNFTSLVAKIGTDKKLFAVSEQSGQSTTPKTLVATPLQGTTRTNNPTLDALRASQKDQEQNLA